MNQTRCYIIPCILSLYRLDLFCSLLTFWCNSYSCAHISFFFFPFHCSLIFAPLAIKKQKGDGIIFICAYSYSFWKSFCIWVWLLRKSGENSSTQNTEDCFLELHRQTTTCWRSFHRQTLTSSANGHTATHNDIKYNKKGSALCNRHLCTANIIARVNEKGCITIKPKRLICLWNW